MEARMERLEKAILTAMGKNYQATPPEKVKAVSTPEEVHPQYGPPGEPDYQANANAAGYWNHNGGWNPGRQRDAPWREYPNFWWTDQNTNPPTQPALSYPQQPAITYPQQSEGQSTWQNRSQDGKNNWNSNRGQGNQQNWVNRNQNNQMVSYVHLHQRGYQGNNSSPQPPHQGNQGPHGNFHHGQGSGSNNPQGTSTSHPSSKLPKNMDDLVGDLLNSRQHLQGNMQANNDVVHRLQDVQQEQKTAMDMLTKQLSKIATTLNEMRGHDVRIPATVKLPYNANISKITLRSGKNYAEPSRRVEKESEELNQEKSGTRKGDETLLDEVRRPLPQMVDLLPLDQEPDELIEETKRDEGNL